MIWPYAKHVCVAVSYGLIGAVLGFVVAFGGARVTAALTVEVRGLEWVPLAGALVGAILAAGGYLRSEARRP